jgi:hypothetical protein
VAFSFLQDLGGISGTPDVGVDDTESGDNGILSALENVGVNFAAGAASVGLNSLARSSGTSPVVAPYSSGTLARPAGSTAYATRSQLPASQPFSTGTLVVGGLFLFLTLGVVVAISRR